MRNYLEPVLNKTESIIDMFVFQADRGMEKISNIPDYLLKEYNGAISRVEDLIFYQFNKKTMIGTFLRYSSYPWSLVIPIGYKYFTANTRNRALIFSPGVHMIRSHVGGGKSLTSFILAEIYLESTGLGSYFTSPVEKPQVTKDGKYLYVYHRVIDTGNYYKDGKKVLNYNSKKYKAIHKDERHLEYNPRLNTTKEYKNKFIPEQQDEILMRHEGIEYIYKYSQYMKLDSQDMDALTYMHDVETVKDIPIKRWLETGELNYIPVVLKFNTFVIEIAFDGGMKRKKIGSCKIPIPYHLLQRFDTHAEAYRHAGLPLDF